MSRVINPNSAGVRRNQALRNIAVALRHLMARPNLDGEAKDLAAQIVFDLRDIAQGIEESTVAWEKRGYYLKADQFRRDWAWAGRSAGDLERVLRAGRWEELPLHLARLSPHLADVTVTGGSKLRPGWEGSYARLTAQEPASM